MRMGRPLQVLRLRELERAQLQTYAQSRALPAGLVSRATVILLAAEGLPNADIAAQLGLAPVTVGNYRRRWLAHGVAGLYDAPRDGRPRTHDDDAVARVLRKVLRTKPTTHTQWSVRTVADATQISKSTVQRYFALFGVQPHRSKSFKLSTDPFFIAYSGQSGQLLRFNSATESESFRPVRPVQFGHAMAVSQCWGRAGVRSG